VARKAQAADLDMGLDQFGLAGRVMARIRCRAATISCAAPISTISASTITCSMARGWRIWPRGGRATRRPAPIAPPGCTAWLGQPEPAAAVDPVTTVRKVEFADAKDLKEWMWKGVDGIAETTWPGVYNRSRLPGRDDYFELPDWNVYVEGARPIA
jgi:hypothetical protein